LRTKPWSQKRTKVTTVILYLDEYNQKVEKFISSNNFITANADITKNLQREIRNTVNECQRMIHKSERWKYVNLNHTALTMRGLVKLHKEDTPIRLIMNWRNTPGYKLAQMLVRKLTSYIPLPFAYNIKNTVQLMNDLIEIPHEQNMKFASFDISSMYLNIPTMELMVILRKLCEVNSVDDKTTQEITRIAQTLVEQNYFQFQDSIYVQNEGLDMGAPTSSIQSEVYLQYVENTTIYELLIKHKVEGYFRYVDDILMMYKDDKTYIRKVLEDFNDLVPSLKFTLEKEQNNQINFLDITINKNQDGLSFEIYRKPTATDIIIPNDSCHPREHETVAIRYYCNRLETYKLTPGSRQKEKDNIQQILANKKYDAHSIEKFHKEKRQRQNEQKQKWAKFTYIGKETRFITKLFKSTNVKIAFTTNNTIEKRLVVKQETHQSKYDRSGVYQLMGSKCKMKYTGQTGKPFRVRFQEHVRDFKYNKNRSKFVQHLIDNKHAIRNMEDNGGRPHDKEG